MVTCIEDLPDEVIFHLSTFLGPIDFVRFTLTSSHFFNLFENGGVEWKKRLQRDLGMPCPTIQRISRELLESGNAVTQNQWKLTYLMQKKTLTNWSLDNYVKVEPEFMKGAKHIGSATKVGTFAYFLQPNSQGHQQISLHNMDEAKLEWKEEIITVKRKLEFDEVDLRVNDIRFIDDKIMLKVTCSNAYKRLLVCYDSKLGKTLWTTIARYSPYNFPGDYDNVVVSQETYIILCYRKVSARILTFSLKDGELITDFEVYCSTLGRHTQICPLQNWLVFTLFASPDDEPHSYTLNLSVKDDVNPLLSGKKLSDWSYPIAVLDSSAILCDDDVLTVWSLKTSQCETTIPLNQLYFFVRSISILSMSTIDIVASGWVDSNPEDQILHIFKVKGNSVTVLNILDFGLINSFSTCIGILGESPIIVNVAIEKANSKIMTIGCGKNEKSKVLAWKQTSDFTSVKFLAPTCVGILLNSSLEVRDYLQIDYYTLKRNKNLL